MFEHQVKPKPRAGFVDMVGSVLLGAAVICGLIGAIVWMVGK